MIHDIAMCIKECFQNAACFFLNMIDSGGALEDVLGLEGVLEDTIWSHWPRRPSPWPWPRSLQVLENALSSAREQHYFLTLKMGQGYDQFCFVLKNAREPEKKFEDIFFL